MCRIWFILFIFFILPAAANAAIVINEIAWMGTDVSANDEWIELHNTGDENVPLDEWTLSDGMGLEVSLAGSIASGQYAVLERTDDSSAPGSAFLIYTGALANTGATLTLSRPDGSIEDRVAGGENWEQIGGDNVTKETAQYSTAGWVTAVATPGKVNTIPEIKNNDDEASEESDDEKSKVSAETKKPKGEPVQLILPDVALSLSVDAPHTAYVNQSVFFEVEPSGLGEVIMDSLQYEWNFGDMYTGTGEEIEHTFKYPGEYVVTVRGTYTRHEQIARMSIIVLPVKFSMTKNLRGDIQLHNDARYEVNISGYMLRGQQSFVFPPRTIMLPGATITVPKEKLSVKNGEQIQLLDVERTLAAAYTSGLQDTTFQGTERVASYVPEPTIVNESNQPFVFYDSNQQPEEEISSIVSTTSVATATSTPNANLAANVGTMGHIPNEAFPYLGLIGVMALGIFGVYAAGARKHN